MSVASLLSKAASILHSRNRDRNQNPYILVGLFLILLSFISLFYEKCSVLSLILSVVGFFVPSYRKFIMFVTYAVFKIVFIQLFLS